MVFPPNVHEIVKKAVKRYPQDTEKATDTAVARIKKLENYEALLNVFFRQAVKCLVYDQKHTTNTAIKNKAGRPKITPKTTLTCLIETM